MESKKYQNDFYRNFNGTSAWETFSLIYPASLLTFIATAISSIIITKIVDQSSKSKLKSIYNHFLIDFIIIIIPMILSMTILDEYATHYAVLLLSVASFIFLYYSKKPHQKITPHYLKEPKQNFITNARAIITILSCIAILAVDFKVFPRRFAKTETFGYSLMDVGVGLFVFSNGVVSAEARNKPQTLFKSFCGTIPLWILGVGRFLATKEADYYVPVSEYGVHWNFFITLAVTRLISSVILKCISIQKTLYISMFVLTLHEYFIQAALGKWVLGVSPRNNLIQANREGISATLGYVGLYFLSVHMGKIMLKQKQKYLFFKLLFSSVAFLVVSLIAAKYFGVSRRLANVGYCCWIMFLGVFMCFLLLFGENISTYLYAITGNTNKIYIPLIYNAANYNGLLYFLLSNILTGLVNMSIRTVHVGVFNSMFILILYKFIVCFVVSILYVKKIKFKIW